MNDQLGLFRAERGPRSSSDPLASLVDVCMDGTCMIFMYGCDNGMVTARTHDEDDGGDAPMHVTLEDAMRILDEYCFKRHSRYSGEFGDAVVYLADRKAQRKEANERGSTWLNTARFV